MDEGGGAMTLTFAALGEFGDAISFIFTSRENQRGAPVGGSHNLPLLWEHLKLCGAAMGLALLISLPLGLILGHTGKGSFLAISTSNVGRAVPSVALIALFIAFLPEQPGVPERHARAGAARDPADPHQHLRGGAARPIATPSTPRAGWACRAARSSARSSCRSPCR